ncbi:Cell division cycle protein 123 [Babesia bigemina]|uniref:Cell division cycle protein 123 n=1 Tax=Babesia bigemina TaxID=5866 RepID=A0A061D7Q5_BABBI|nr:Cell division cycle protein 123 [Babesia bigemina]CDR96721.1 Cell division cycle protein 123 [Babesia bigemina]|eukprot:XP_012768907.1 Cell division cycle protein 123 [Babesia bigemina]
MESLLIDYPLRPIFITGLWQCLGGHLRVKTSRGVGIEPTRLRNVLEVTKTANLSTTSTSIGSTSTNADAFITNHLTGDVKFLLFADGLARPDKGVQTVEGFHLSLIRASVTYNNEDGILEVVPTEATQMPPCPAGVTAWKHYSTYAEGMDNGSFTVESHCKEHMKRLLREYAFNEEKGSSMVAPQIGALDAVLYVLWNWVSESGEKAIGSHMYIMNNDEGVCFSHENVKRNFGSMLIPNSLQILEGSLLDYLKSDNMSMPPNIDQIKYKDVDSGSDFDGYESMSDSDDSFDWSAVEPFVEKLKALIAKYQSVVPSINGVFLDDALWVANMNVECTSAREVLLLLKSSTCWQDLEGSQCHLTLYPGIYFRGRLQLRCFLFENELVCVEQIFVNENFGFLAKDAQSLVGSLKSYSPSVMGVLNKGGVRSAIFDVTVSTKNGEIEMLNIYQFGSLPDGLLQLEDVYHFYYTGKSDGLKPLDLADMAVVDGVLVVFVGANSSRLQKHAWCPNDIGNLSFNTHDDLIDYLRFQAQEM